MKYKDVFFIGLGATVITSIISALVYVGSMGLMVALEKLFPSWFLLLVAFGLPIAVKLALFMRIVADTFTPFRPVAAYAKLLGITFLGSCFVVFLSTTGQNMNVVSLVIFCFTFSPWSAAVVLKHKRNPSMMAEDGSFFNVNKVN
ncbi:MAG: hypothetical protein ACRCYP_05260 [Alphaproteobacteria bacterium]